MSILNIVIPIVTFFVGLIFKFEPKHFFRLVSLLTGILLVILAIFDGLNDLLPNIEAQWLLGSGAILIVAAARKLPTKL